jgi:hypothetical protein
MVPGTQGKDASPDLRHGKAQNLSEAAGVRLSQRYIICDFGEKAEADRLLFPCINAVTGRVER